MTDNTDTGICSTGDTRYYSISSDEKKIVNKIMKLAKEYPDSIILKAKPEENDGCVYAWLPKDWIKIYPPRKITMTDERRKQMVENMAKVRAKKTSANE